MPTNIGLEIRRLRKKKNISTEQLANQLGYADRQSVYDMENKTKRFDFMLLTKLATIFEVEISYFFPFINEKDQKEILQISNDQKQILSKEDENLMKKYQSTLEENSQLKSKIILLQEKLLGGEK